MSLAIFSLYDLVHSSDLNKVRNLPPADLFAHADSVKKYVKSVLNKALFAHFFACPDRPLG